MTRLTPQDKERIRTLRYRDGLTVSVVARMVGCSLSYVRLLAPGRPGKVPNDKLRAAFEASGVSASEVARRLGWGSGRSVDASRVRRALGLTRDVNGDGHRGTRCWIDAEMAALLAEAIGLMPWEVMPDEEQAA